MLGIEPFLVPSPAEIANSLWDDRSLLAENAWVTLREILLGLAVAIVRRRSLFAVVLHLSDALRRAIYPLVVASQTIPIVVIAPILVVWFGFGIGAEARDRRPRLLLPDHRQHPRRAALGRPGADQADAHPRRRAGWQIFRRVELPTALPLLFSGMKIAAAIAPIGAVFGEWAGSDAGLGHLILTRQRQLQTARVFAAVAVLSAIAIVLFGLLTADRAARRAWWRGTQAMRAPHPVARPGPRRRARLAGCGEKSEETHRERAQRSST